MFIQVFFGQKWCISRVQLSLRYALLLCISGITSAVAQSGQPVQPMLPLESGFAVATCYSGSATGGYVLGIYDINDPANHAVFDANWPAPKYHAPNWKSQDFSGDEIYGLAIDNNLNLYASSTSSYGQNLNLTGSGRVFKIDSTTGAVGPACCGTNPYNPLTTTCCSGTIQSGVNAACP